MKRWLVIVSSSLVAGLLLVFFGFLEIAAPHRLKDSMHQDKYHPEYQHRTPLDKSRHSAARSPLVAVEEAPKVDHNYYGTFATFTEHFPVLDNRSFLLRGPWSETKNRMELLANFSNRKGETEGSFEFIPGIRKTLLHLTIFDEVYYDSNSVDLTINLKMSKFDIRSRRKKSTTSTST